MGEMMDGLSCFYFLLVALFHFTFTRSISTADLSFLLLSCHIICSFVEKISYIGKVAKSTSCW